jgi:glyoxylase-like metal-dependent hydrolase (beta-lactamase superfamily II)
LAIAGENRIIDATGRCDSAQGRRRMTFRVIHLAIFAALFFSSSAQAQLPVDFSQTEITTTALRDDVYMLQGEGGNIVVAVAADGLLVIDSQFAPLYDRIRTAISDISDRPVRYLVNTHHHGDHTGGNERFAADGAVIVSQENMRDLMANGFASGLTGVETPPAPASAVPSLTYADSLTLDYGGRSADLRYPGDSHTNGDTYVYFPDADILVTGDVVTFGRYPNIDFANGGHIDLMISATDAFIASVDDDTVVVPGHGPVGDRDDLVEYREMLAVSRDRVKALMDDGRTVDEIIAARPNADYDVAMNVDERRIGNWIRVIYYSYMPN